MIPVLSSFREKNEKKNEKKELPVPIKSDPIKSEWLGVEARVHLPPRMLVGNRFIDWRRHSSIGTVLFSFLSGIAMGGFLAFFVTRGESGPVMPDMVKAVNPSKF